MVRSSLESKMNKTVSFLKKFCYTDKLLFLRTLMAQYQRNS